MNQILSMQPGKNNYNSGKKKKEKVKTYGNQPSNKADIVKVIRIFCILIIIFAMTIIGTSTYAFVNSTPKEKDNIQVSTEKIGLEATITVQGEKPIKELVYYWGQEEETVVEGNGTVTLQVTVDIPDGNNILHFYVIDYYGNKTEYYKQYINNRTDTTDPTIELTVTGNMINIIATDDTELSYMIYYWNDEEETRVDMGSDVEDITTLEARVEVLKGQNTLTIVAVDAEGNKTTKTQSLKGANKPTFEVSVDGNQLVINAKDDECIKNISVTIDGVTSETGDISDQNLTEATVTTEELTAGSHTITVVVTNISDLSEEQSYNANL